MSSVQRASVTDGFRTPASEPLLEGGFSCVVHSPVPLSAPFSVTLPAKACQAAEPGADKELPPRVFWERTFHLGAENVY